MLTLAAALPATLATLMPLTAALNEPVRVEGGLLAGVPGSDPAVTAFKGVPYAAPPVGDLRWRAPQPPARWDGVRKADEFSANCVQRMRDSLGPWTSEYQPHGAVSEDCLYLNVWTAAVSTRDKRPVLVYIHGGAFTDGSGDVPVYDGENLAKKGVVVVTINYRVGPLGFFTHPELTKESSHASSGNYGLLDQVAALKWIQANVHAFGGDPTRVTIAGQSAGAASVLYLSASPLAKGLFAQAIAGSGARLHMGPDRTLAQSEQDGVRFAESRQARTLKELRALPADTLASPLDGGFAFRPIVDGWFLRRDVDQAFAAGEQNDVPTVTGWTYDEGSFNSEYGKMSAEEFQKQVRQRAGPLAEALLRLYPAATLAEAAESQKASARDQAMVSTYLWALHRAKTAKTAVFTYLFTHPQPGPTQPIYGVFHSSELPYVFDNLDKSDRPWTALDRKIADTLSAYWVNFIKSGDPNGAGLPRWPAFSPGKADTMELGATPGPRPIADPPRLDLLEQLLNARPQP
jgi:para-nitrobenzyl esterase